MRVLVIANRGDGDAGWVGEHLRDGHGAHLVRGWREEPEAWPELEGVDLVVALGSDWSVYWDHVQTSVEAEAALVRQAHGQGRPVLGICFGAQLLARALGGRVERAPEAEVGWYDLTVGPGAPFDGGPWFQWHVDRFEPPATARVLAHTDRAVQAFALERTLAVQFHPEVTQDMVERWSAGDGVLELERLGVDRDELVAATAQYAVQRRRHTGAIVDAVLGPSLT